MSFLPVDIERKWLLRLLNKVNAAISTDVTQPSSATNVELKPNTMNVWNETGDSITITLANNTEDVTAEYMLQFDTGDTVPTLNVPSTVKWVQEPNIEANHRYQISILNDVGLIVGVPL